MFKTERQHTRELIERTRFLALRMILQCVTDLTIGRGLNQAEAEMDMLKAKHDCFDDRGFIALACNALGYNVEVFRGLAREYLAGTIDIRGLKSRITIFVEGQEAA